MKILSTILIVILTIILGRWIITFKPSVLYEAVMFTYSTIFIGVFGYGVYKILENVSKDN